jgi:serpin B
MASVRMAACSCIVLGALLLVAGCSREEDPVAIPARRVPGAARTLGRHTPWDEEVVAVVEGHTAFAIDLYGRLAQGDANLAISPGGLSVGLAMVYGGARRKTARQMADVVGLPVSDERLHPVFGGLGDRLQVAADSEGTRLRIANALWVQAGEKWQPEFMQPIVQYYGGALREANFGTPRVARRLMSTWVEHVTEGRVEDLVPAGVPSDPTALVLTNAVCLEGQWASPFSPANTLRMPFHLASGGTADVPIMRQTGSFAYTADDDVRVLELPYAGGYLSLVVVLPRSRKGLPDAERGTDPEKLARWLSALQPTRVMVSLPRFTISSDFRLDRVLGEMGMETAFGKTKADFAGMNGGEPRLHMEGVLHAARLEVSEGSRQGQPDAGAATDQPVGERAELFVADHPFLFFVRDRKTGFMLFLGRVTDPSR